MNGWLDNGWMHIWIDSWMDMKTDADCQVRPNTFRPLLCEIVSYPSRASL